ncbi:MAG TPA: hypothetical protein VKS01_00205 [Bryobacteraceae bacterium]|nr:hypothetical protein [Bryobacteraceae bacterium]
MRIIVTALMGGAFLIAQSKLPRGDGAPSQAAKAQAANSAPSSGPGFYRMKLVKVLDNEGFGQGVEAARLLVPADWKIEGGVHWVGGQLGCPSNIIQVSFKATAPDGVTGIEFGPGYSWASNSDPQGMRIIQQLAAQKQGCDGGPVVGPIDYLRGRILQKYRPGARILGSEPLPDLTREKTDAMMRTYGPLVRQGTMRAAKAEAGSVHISYTQNGQPVEEWISTTIDTLVSPTINSAAMMRGQMVYRESSFSLSSEGFFAARAPMGKFDKKLAATIIASTRPNPQYQEAVGNFLLSMAKIQQKGAMDRQKIWHDAQQQISSTINDSYRRQQAAQDRAAEQFDQTIRGVETYVNPGTGEKVELTGGYNNAWVNGLGEYILSDSAGFNPNAALKGNWQQLNHAKQ